MKRVWMVPAVVAFALCGCDQKGATAVAEEHERNSVDYRRARASELAGDISGAIQKFELALKNNPGESLAHFQLAVLLQDHAHDYVGAIYHYERYIESRPDADKKKLAQERIRLSEQLLVPQLLKKTGVSTGAASGLSEADAAKLRQQVEDLSAAKAELEESCDKLKADLQRAAAESTRLRALVKDLRAGIAEGDVESPASITSEETRQPEEPERQEGITSISREELLRLREEVQAASRESEETSAAPAPEVQKKQKPTPRVGPRTYVVQPGDTLHSISQQFYKSRSQWMRILNANRSSIDTDGRIQAGQTLVIP